MSEIRTASLKRCERARTTPKQKSYYYEDFAGKVLTSASLKLTLR